MAKWRKTLEDARQERSTSSKKGKKKGPVAGRLVAFPDPHRKSSFLVAERKELLAKDVRLDAMYFAPHELIKANANDAYDKWDSEWLAKKLLRQRKGQENVVEYPTPQ